jgi:hypothetical protein
MVWLLANAADREGFASLAFLFAGCYMILKTAWCRLVGEITIADGLRINSFSPAPTRIVNYYTNPQEFWSIVRLRIVLAAGIILFAVILIRHPGT